jgi:hypothetical protein
MRGDIIDQRMAKYGYYRESVGEVVKMPDYQPEDVKRGFRDAGKAARRFQ